MEILHKMRKDNILENALSRNDEELALLVSSVLVPECINEI